MKRNWRLLIKSIVKDIYKKPSYAQNGEDRVANYYLKEIEKGNFVDIGSFHPRKYSNTNLLYKRGWSGINIDPNPDHIKIFNKERKRDINLNVGVSLNENILDYYCFNHPAINSFDKKHAEFFMARPDISLMKTIKVQTLSLKTILNKNFERSKPIHFMNIDVEGMDMEVLLSNDWEVYRPWYILIEDLNCNSFNDIENSNQFKFLTEKKYVLISKVVHSMLFKDATQEAIK